MRTKTHFASIVVGLSLWALHLAGAAAADPTGLYHSLVVVNGNNGVDGNPMVVMTDSLCQTTTSYTIVGDYAQTTTVVGCESSLGRPCSNPSVAAAFNDDTMFYFSGPVYLYAHASCTADWDGYDPFYADCSYVGEHPGGCVGETREDPGNTEFPKWFVCTVQFTIDVDEEAADGPTAPYTATCQT